MKPKKNKKPDHSQDDRERNDALNKNEKKPGQERLPGEYPPSEDIMNRMNTDRVGIDVQNFSRTIGSENINMDEPIVTDPDSVAEEPILAEGDLEDQRDQVAMEHPVPAAAEIDSDRDAPVSESDVTEEDLQALGPKDLSLNMGEDEQLLKNRVWPVDMAGEDLDVPGTELDDESESIGSEDEENNSYSLGGDRHEDNMEGK